MLAPVPIGVPSTNHQRLFKESVAPARSWIGCRVMLSDTINSLPLTGETMASPALSVLGRAICFTSDTGHGSSTGSSAAASASAAGAAASAPIRAGDPFPSALPNQTTTVRRWVTAAHQASRWPLLVPVFQATLLRDASGQRFAVRSGEAMASRAAKQEDASRTVVEVKGGRGSR